MSLRTLMGMVVIVALQATGAEVTDERLVAADGEPHSWLSHGRNYAEDRESPLTQITRTNVAQLGLAWYFDTDTTRGLEATPLVIDGVMYTTGSWSTVFALDAATGALLWSYDPRVPRAWGVNACCDVVNRGVAAAGDNVYLGTLDGRLVALNRHSGDVVWEVLTIDPARPYTITGAPRVVKGNVIIGNGGAEYGVRGYLSAYDAISGDLIWRFYTVPGNPADPYESDAMRLAAATWSGDVYWQVGGGGTVWDSMAYDPALNLLYFGVGNGAPWNRHIRSPGGGDNLFLSSIVAVNANTGEYAWHYQTTPGDSWDYTATQHIILADLTIAGIQRTVLMQAPKNGFFYVLDRATGELLSAEKYAAASWASHIDLATGRPVETVNADHSTTTRITRPAPTGGHNWQPMAFNHEYGLVYIPAMDSASSYSTVKDFIYRPLRHWNTAQGQDTTTAMASVPDELAAAVLRHLLVGQLIAWDPVRQQEVWRVKHRTMWNGGVLTTRSGLVFQGTGDGRFVAYNGADGAELWASSATTGVIAAPMSYEIAGTQYVAIMAGWGGAGALIANLPGSVSAGTGRVLVYKLGGQTVLPTPATRPQMPPPPRQGTDESTKRGAALYNTHCGRCHGMALSGSGVVTDLRTIGPLQRSAFRAIVLEGILAEAGMVGFADVLSPPDADAIHDYIIDGANAKWEADHAPAWWRDLRWQLYDAIGRLIAWLL